MKYECDCCGMSINELKCGKCGSTLVDDTITGSDGKKVQVAQCPNDCGKIKSPQCCNQDMHTKAS